MEIIEFEYPQVPVSQEKIILCLGYFDGIHLGHQKLIKDAIKEGYKVGVLTFDNPPSLVLGKITENRSLSSIADKVEFLEEIGVSYIYLMHFDESVAKMSKDTFVNEVLKVINPIKLYCGEDYKFGMFGEGTPEFLKQSFDVVVHSFECKNGHKISTRDIVELVINGPIETANELLGRPYRINGLVVEGLHNGAKINFPTANVNLDYPYAFPKDGVYYGYAIVYDRKYRAIISIGNHPSIMPLKKSIIEVHILDYEGNLYGKDIFVEFVKYARDITRFDSVDHLVEQLNKDKKNCLEEIEL